MMSKKAKGKILTAAVLCACTTLWANPAWAVEVTINSWEQFKRLKDNGDFIGVNVGRGIAYKPANQNNKNKITINVRDNIPLIGSDIAAGMGNGNTLVIKGGIFGEKGASSTIYPDKSSSVYGSVGSEIAENNTVKIYDGIFYQDVYGARVSGTNVSAKLNKVNIYGGVVEGDVTGGYASDSGVVESNSVLIKDAEVRNVKGGYGKGNVINNKIEISGSAKVESAYGGHGLSGANVFGNIITISDTAKINHVLYGGYTNGGKTENNRVIITGNSEINSPWIRGGYSVNNDANDNFVEISGGTINSSIAGGYGSTANNNKVILSGGIIKMKRVYGGYSDDIKEANNNIIILKNNINVTDTSLFGSNMKAFQTEGNNLIVNNWIGKAYSIENFNNVNFENLIFDSSVEQVMDLNKKADLSKTGISVTFAGGQEFEKGSSMTLINNAEGYQGSEFDNEIQTAAGVAQVVTGDITNENDKIVLTIDDVKLNDQTKLVAENRAVAAAFINQGTDLIADSLDTLSRDGKYGVKTFAAVHGNRSKYDVNSDIKINGWSTIVGVGSENEHNGGDFSWGVFYENGSGNYRTYNEFNNEFFRGDGSLVYNGGGVAARYENAHGVYTEGSLRAGMLKSEMTDALSDGENKYGYKSESEYYGAHIGIGQIIPLSESSALDVYGKFFHTYTEGDSFNVAGDEFEFDSINSERLRIGARLTTNKENKFSTYYGLAYEYEFNGDAEMRAAGMDAPTQSLQGSSYMAEIGLNYQPTPDSPWSFELNMRGYAGEREGATFNAQATYTF